MTAQDAQIAEAHVVTNHTDYDMNKMQEIIEAWSIAKNPTEEQRLLAETRLAICNGCEYKIEVPEYILVCARCGCPLKKKIFTPSETGCPLSKW
jgi:dUTPase